MAITNAEVIALQQSWDGQRFAVKAVSYPHYMGLINARIASIAHPAHIRQLQVPVVGCNHVLSGNAHIIDENGLSYPVCAGDIFIRFPGRELHVDPTSPYIESHFAVDERTGTTLIELGVIPNSPKTIGNVGLDDTILQAYANIWHWIAQTDQLAPIQVLSHISRLMQLIEHSSQTQQAMHTTTQRLQLARQMVSDIDGFTFEAIATRLQLSYRQFRRWFTQETGITPGQFRIRARIERACSLLSDYSVSDTAEKLGYPNPYSFSKQFRQVMGMPPSTFRSHTQQNYRD